MRVRLSRIPLCVLTERNGRRDLSAIDSSTIDLSTINSGAIGSNGTCPNVICSGAIAPDNTTTPTCIPAR
ncbi:MULTISPECIES: hypothetical protein [Thiorhodovibrio]|uniref:hypothetical protein n=1 Tax=Thiorhodovibrio TaxID=61593 RepID=UPI001F5C4D5A|nr:MULTISPECIES: hypothetical protein [Thiorhodovibrio]